MKMDEYTHSMRLSFFLLPFIIFFIGLLGLGAWIFLLYKPSVAGWNDDDQALVSFSHGTIVAEVASSTIKKYHGLSGHAPLAENTGMLFIFDHPDTYPFIMRAMTFPLDFVWLTDNRVADVDENVPAPRPGEKARVVVPQEPITMVLEVPAGTISRLAIHVGDVVTITH
jgi:hypothetical protein